MRVRIVVRTDDVVLYRQDGPVSTIWYRRYGTILTIMCKIVAQHAR